MSESAADAHQRDVATVRVQTEAEVRDYLKEMVASLTTSHDENVQALIQSMRKEVADYVNETERRRKGDYEAFRSEYQRDIGAAQAHIESIEALYRQESVAYNEAQRQSTMESKELWHSRDENTKHKQGCGDLMKEVRTLRFETRDE